MRYERKCSKCEKVINYKNKEILFCNSCSKPNKLKEDQINEIIKLHKDGKCGSDIAKEMNVSPSTISRYLKKNKLPQNKPKKRIIASESPIKDQILSLHSQGLTNKEIVNKGYKLCVIYNILHINNLKSNKENKKVGEIEVKILELYHKGFKNREISRSVNCHHRTVAYYLNKNALKSNGIKNQPIDKVDEFNARCSKCHNIKSINEFQKTRRGQKYECHFSYCNECRRKQSYLNLNSSIEKLLKNCYNRTKARCFRKNIIFNIGWNEFLTQYNNQKGLCFYTNIPMELAIGKGISRNSLSIDKIIPEIGYVSGNVVFCVYRANTIKTDMTLQEMSYWMPSWYEKIKNKFKNIQLQEVKIPPCNLDDFMFLLGFVRDFDGDRVFYNDLNGNNILAKDKEACFEEIKKRIT